MIKENILVSLIVPVYKAEKYIDKCVESIVNQTYQNLEIILVDDGSPDNCPKICDEWAKKDSRIKVIHKENGGVSSARNVGLDNVNGEYVMFVDSDDWLEVSAVNDLLVGRGFDFICGSCNVICKKKIITKVLEKKEYDKNSLKQFFKDEKGSNFYFSNPWAKLYKYSLIKENNLQFNERLKAGEDYNFNINFFSYARKFIALSSIIYNYNALNSSSITHNYLADTYEFKKTTYSEIYNWLNLEFVDFLQEYYVKFVVADSIQYYILMCEKKDCIMELNKLGTMEKLTIINHAEIIDNYLGGGYFKYLLKFNWKKVLSRYKRKHIKWTIKKFLVKLKLYK